MTGGGENILAPVSFLSVQVRVDMTVADTEGRDGPKINKGVKIRYLMTLIRRWVTDFDLFTWNPSGRVRTFT